MKEEIWKDIIGYEGLYQVSSLGRVKSFIRKGILKPSTTPQGYLKVVLRPDKKQMTVHRLVALAFLPNPDNKPQINHKNMIKTDNNITNLEWITNRDNLIHRSISRGRKLPTGVYHASKNSFQARIYDKNKKGHHLGSFDNKEDAGKAYETAYHKIINNAF